MSWKEKSERKPFVKNCAAKNYSQQNVLMCFSGYFLKTTLPCITLLIVVVFFFLFPTKIKTTGPRVETPEAIFEGFEYENKNGSKSHIFLGIRYAQAPIGKLRFEVSVDIKNCNRDQYKLKRPMPREKVETLEMAKSFAPACFPLHVQEKDLASYSEDCLFLNIIKPAKKPVDSDGYPVLIFIHGGGFIRGSAATVGYEGLSENFAVHGIIVVTIQYRVGPLGFFSTGDDILPGNMGLWDQAFALEFLHRILPQFDGNPHEITLWGQSAGAASVHALTISPYSKNYFKRAIQNSGSLFAEWALNENVVTNSYTIAKSLNCSETNSENIRDCMVNKSMKEIIEAGNKLSAFNEHSRLFAFNPRYDKKFFPQPITMLMNLNNNVKVLFGLTNKEWPHIASFPGYSPKNSNERRHFYKNELKGYIEYFIAPSKSNDHKNTIINNAFIEYFVNSQKFKTGTNSSLLSRATDIISDIMFVVPVIQQIKFRTLLNQESYLFYQKYYHGANNDSNAIIRGAKHGNENFYILNKDSTNIEFTENDKIFKSNLLQGYKSFILTGMPESSAIQWPNVGPQSERNIVLNPGIKIEESFEKERMKFWTQKLPATVGTNALKRRHLPFHLTNLKNVFFV